MSGRVVSFWLPDELIERVDAAAADAALPRNRWVRYALEEIVYEPEGDVGDQLASS